MKRLYLGTTLLLVGLFLQLTNQPSFAEESSQQGGAEIEITPYKEKDRSIRDPEDPSKRVDAGESPFTTDDLRIDFVPQLNFSTVLLSDKDSVFAVNAQLFHDDTSARGNFIQVSDYRDHPNGWTLQVRQEHQFKHATKEGEELKGAVISFDQAWTSSEKEVRFAPTVSKKIIQMNNIGETYNLAVAPMDKGTGTWSVVFGASGENKNERPNSLSLRKDQNDQELIDPVFEKAVYSNQAITLSVPGATEKQAGAYSTVLTWLIAELP
ncbi:WxL domain-containing protein [Enterococcus sp. LJL99]